MHPSIRPMINRFSKGEIMMRVLQNCEGTLVGLTRMACVAAPTK